tara:strand:+ start:240 stop:452 length:213 start_codon:yes stop_codon:yes gene_type:complete
MADDDHKDSKFEISARVLGNELIAFKMAADNKNNKWLLAGLLSIAFLIWAIGEFGPVIGDFFHSVSGSEK